MRRILYILFLSLSTSLLAQNTLTGIVFDDKGHKPANFASVYINGSTKGTYTDATGHFVISDVSFPCQLVISHIGYYPKTITIEKAMSDKQMIYLTEKARQLSDVSVTGSGRRMQNIEEFKKVFLGNDRWGKNAVLKNDSALVFLRYIDTLRRKATTSDFEKQRLYNKLDKYSKWSSDSAHIVTYSPVFDVKSKEPLLIELPLLGYSVYLDLESFKLKIHKGLTVCDYRGYTRFIPHNTKSYFKKARYEKNRQLVYYNSSRHFCKSLFDNKLKENGYLISVKTFNDSMKIISYNYTDFRSNIKVISSNEIGIIGLKYKKMDMYYFCDSKGCPTDLSKFGAISDWTSDVWKDWDWKNDSSISLQSDSCTISSDGAIPHNSILFGGKIASKRGSVMLPTDYLPLKSKK